MFIIITIFIAIIIIISQESQTHKSINMNKNKNKSLPTSILIYEIDHSFIHLAGIEIVPATNHTNHYNPLFCSLSLTHARTACQKVI